MNIFTKINRLKEEHQSNNFLKKFLACKKYLKIWNNSTYHKMEVKYQNQKSIIMSIKIKILFSCLDLN